MGELCVFYELRTEFLGAFGKLRKAAVSCVMSALSARMEQLGSNWTDFHEILYLSILRKIRREDSSFINI
jgi:hypothetical protein